MIDNAHSYNEDNSMRIIHEPFRPPAWIDYVSFRTLMPWQEDRIRLMLKNLCSGCGGPRDREFIEKWCPSQGAELLRRLDQDRAEHKAKERAKMAAEVAQIVKTKTVPPIVAKKSPPTIEQRVQAIADQYHRGELTDLEFANKIDGLNKLEMVSIKPIPAKVVDTLITPPTESTATSQPQVLSAYEQIEAKLKEEGLMLMHQQQCGQISSEEFAVKLKALRTTAKLWLEQLTQPKRRK